MTQEHDIIPPSASAGDVIHAGARALLSAIPIPFVGGAATELLNLMVAPPLERRRVEWMRAVSTRLSQLAEERALDLARIRDRPEFVDAVIQASTIALRSHREEKHRALQNAILNVAVDENLVEAQMHLFLQFIDRFSAAHLRILDFVDDPAKWAAGHGIEMTKLEGEDVDRIVSTVAPDLAGLRDVANQIWKDLFGSGLLQTHDLQYLVTMSGLSKQRHTTPLGRRFIAFTRSPLPLP